MKRFGLVMSGAAVASLALWSGTAASQTDPTTTTTPETTTTIVAAPETTTTVAAPETTTTVDTGATTTTAVAPPTTIDLSTVQLPGRAITSGRIAFDLQFKDHPELACNTNLDLSGASLNVINDDEGNVGATYGLVPTNASGGKAGVVMMRLGALPAAVAVVSMTGPCEIDTLGIGNYDAGPDFAKFDGVGAGVKSSNIGEGMFIEHMRINATVGSSADAANLDLRQVESFVMRPRS